MTYTHQRFSRVQTKTEVQVNSLGVCIESKINRKHGPVAKVAKDTQMISFPRVRIVLKRGEQYCIFFGAMKEKQGWDIFGKRK